MLDISINDLVITYYIPYNNHTTLLNNQSIIYLTNDLTEHYNTFYKLIYIVTNLLHIITNSILIYTIINSRYLLIYDIQLIYT